MDVLACVLGTLLMERYGLSFHSDNARIRCLAHIVNIVVQTLLKELDKADDPTTNDNFESMKKMPVHYSPDDDEDLQEMETEDLDVDQAVVDEKMIDEEMP